MIPTALVAALLLQVPASPSRAPQEVRRPATIEGVVVRAGSGEPLARAQVALVPAGESARDDLSSPSTPPAVATGADGRFVFRGVVPGSYRIAAARNGYARQELGQRVFGGHGTVIEISAGQLMRGIAFHLTPTGAVAGVVHDASGEPLVGASVLLLRSSYDEAGQRALQAAGGDRTNDRGEYRVYWMTPGRYYVAVSGAAPGRQAPLPGAVGSVNEIVERRYPTTYYPGTTDVEQAALVDVPPGAEVTTVDFVIPEQDLFHVSGQIIDPVTGHHPSRASVSVIPRGPTGTPVATAGPSQSYDSATGTFRLADVAPGSYWIRAIVAAGSADSILPPDAAGRSVADVVVDSLFAGRQVAQAPVDVFGDIDGLVLTLGSGVPIRGVVRVDDRPLSSVDGYERVEVTLRPVAKGMLANPSRHEAIGPDGAFTLANVLPGEYAVAVHGLPPDAYLEEARVGDVDVLDRLLVAGLGGGTLNVAISSRGGQVAGVLVNDRRQPVAGVEVVLVPTRRPTRPDHYKKAVSGKSGEFLFRGIPPGDYRIFAWEAIESFGYFDEVLLRQSAGQGTSVLVEESSRERVEVTLIPAGVR